MLAFTLPLNLSFKSQIYLSWSLFYIHQLSEFLNLTGTIDLCHTALVPFMGMRFIVFLLKNHRPVVKLGGGVFQNFRDWAVKLPGNSHRQSKNKTALD